MKPETAMSSIHTKLIGLFAMLMLAFAPSVAAAQQRLQRDGVVLYWGLVPGAVVSQKHALEEMHGVVPKDGGQNHHIVVALFNADGNRIEDAVVRAQLHEIAIVDAPPKYLTPMTIDGHASYGQLFSTATGGPYRFRIFVRVTDRTSDIEFVVSAWSPHREAK
jgi:hypothetical protein